MPTNGLPFCGTKRTHRRAGSVTILVKALLGRCTQSITARDPTGYMLPEQAKARFSDDGVCRQMVPHDNLFSLNCADRIR